MPDNILNQSLEYDINFDNDTNLPDTPTGVTNVKFGANAPLCEVELNEVQELLQRQLDCYKTILALMFKRYDTSNIIFVSDYSVSEGIVTFRDIFASINGKILPLSKSFAVGQGYQYVYLKFQEGIMNDINTPFYRYGFNGSFINNVEQAIILKETVPNYLGEDRVGVGTRFTSQRKYTIYTVEVYSDFQTDENLLYIGMWDGSKLILNEDVVIELPKIANTLERHVHKDLEITINESDWSNTVPYTATKSLESLTRQTDVVNPIVSLVISGNNLTEDSVSAMQDAFSCISHADIIGNNIVLKCWNDKPETTFTINVKAV